MVIAVAAALVFQNKKIRLKMIEDHVRNRSNESPRGKKNNIKINLKVATVFYGLSGSVYGFCEHGNETLGSTQL
jgi:hypothetical protein